MSAPREVLEATMRGMGCERDVDLNESAFCTRHHCGWLSDRDCCAHAERAADAAFAASLEWAAEQLAPAWPNPVMPPADRLRKWAKP